MARRPGLVTQECFRGNRIRRVAFSLPFFSLLVLILPSEASAQFVQFLDGNALKELCDDPGAGGALCNGYIVALADQSSLEIIRNKKNALICIPANVKTEQLYDTVLNYMKAHPSERNFPAAAVVHNAYRSEFPC